MNESLPKVYKNIFDEDYFQYLKKYLNEYNFPSDQPLDYYGSHRLMSFDNDPVLIEAHNKTIDLAKNIFNNDRLLPSYATYIRYFGNKSELKNHLDEGPSTYLLNMCLSYKTQWPIVINGLEFNLEPNEAVAFYATKQHHYRPKFPDPSENIVEMVMFAFVDPDHFWWKVKEDHRNKAIKRFLFQDKS